MKKQKERPKCKHCENPGMLKETLPCGIRRWRPVCAGCFRKRKGKKFWYRSQKKGYCEKCGFVPEHPCQLDVDHKDGDKKNVDPKNLWTLCANCHRLKTWLNKEWTKGA